MQTGTVIDEEGNKVDAVLRPNRVVTFTVGRMTRHINLDDFEELGLQWKPSGAEVDRRALPVREPLDSPRFFRITGEGLS